MILKKEVHTDKLVIQFQLILKLNYLEVQEVHKVKQAHYQWGVDHQLEHLIWIWEKQHFNNHSIQETIKEVELSSKVITNRIITSQCETSEILTNQLGALLVVIIVAKMRRERIQESHWEQWKKSGLSLDLLNLKTSLLTVPNVSIKAWNSANPNTTSLSLDKLAGMVEFKVLEKKSIILFMKASLKTTSIMDMEGTFIPMVTTI